MPSRGPIRGGNGVFALPTGALVYQLDGDLTYGLAVFSLGGLGVNYPASTTNPITHPATPQWPRPRVGLLRVSGDPTGADRVGQLTDRLSIGGGPTVTLANLRADPLFLTAPNDNGNYPAGTHAG